MGVDLSGSGKWTGITAGPDGKLYCAPHHATDILVIDAATGTARRTNMGVDLSGNAKWIGIAAGPDGKLYCAPHAATDILVIDAATGTARRTNMGASLSGSGKWFGIAAGPDGKLYCAPYDATDILVIDPATGTAQRTNMGVDLSGSAKWRGIAAGPDGKLYCAPFDATDILVIDARPPGLYFKDPVSQSQWYYAFPGGSIIKRMEFFDVLQGLASEPKPVTVENRTTVPIQNVQIDVEEQPEEDTVELSLTDDPFVPEELPVTLPGPYDDGTETDPVYVRVVAGEESTAKEPRVVGLSVKAQPVVE